MTDILLPPWLRRSGMETRRLLLLALPICGAQLTQAGMGVADVMMTGRLSATDLAAVSVGASLWMPMMLFMLGTLMGLTPIVSERLGAGDHHRIRARVHQALWISLIMGTLVGLILRQLSAPIFQWMDVPPEVAALSSDYLAGVALGMPGIALFLALRAFSDGMSHTRPALWIGLLGLGINIPANYLLIHGGSGVAALLGPLTPAGLADLPALGALGCGIATALSFWTMGLAMLIYTRRSPIYTPVALWSRLTPPRPALIGELLFVGLPIGVAIFVEVTLFTVIALLVASLGEITVAAHQVALNITSFIFVLPLALGMALTVRVSHTLGAGRKRQARFVAWNGVVISLLTALINGVFLLLLGETVIGFYTHDVQVRALALSLIFLAVLFQLSDALQLNMAGALRGYKDTRVLMLITLLSYWAVGLAAGHGLATRGLGEISPLGVHGYWIGLIMGLTVAALLLGLRLRAVSRADHPLSTEPVDNSVESMSETAPAAGPITGHDNLNKK
ncbi:MATE family efflux transporter [Ectothiorhodospira lacustris]|uniref:MATE family efflux transporter n=1 Tax=Ectothiorhodospira lacustris TaxID=2899127 RepID=UPI001EE97209|nr:MATE family efflux transporter [Ectothiorhodospira lacustris]MCG5500834.1 MATE family efflux transporter [Ectothiorhodospira lacustris]MCG5510615.1 MATE family efflux transporter [Ectothiorhodospira lacustris]MCG5521307.1 MATE family efflux transporter [Ectothiorhodospira lacustris]